MWAVAQSLPGEHVGIVQKLIVLEFMHKPRVTWNEVGLFFCAGKNMLGMV